MPEFLYPGTPPAAAERAGHLARALSLPRYLLEGPDGYVHMLDLSKRTRDRRLAWIGFKAQLERVRELHPETAKMRVIRVPPPSLNTTPMR